MGRAKRRHYVNGPIKDAWKRERPNHHQAPPPTLPVDVTSELLTELKACDDLAMDKFSKFERGAFDGLGGHLWPQTYFTRDCDVVLRYESLASDLNALTKRVGCSVRAPENFVKPPGYGSSRGDLAPSLSYEVLAKARQIYREDYLLYERLRKMDVRARVHAIAARNLMYTQVETVVGASAVGTIYSD